MPMASGSYQRSKRKESGNSFFYELGGSEVLTYLVLYMAFTAPATDPPSPAFLQRRYSTICI